MVQRFHYFSLAADWCPGSGFSDPERTERLRDGVSRGHTYESLITLGLTEDDLLQLVISPQLLSESDVIGLETVCGMDASLSIAQLIQGRNEILLRAFPRGTLWRQLNPTVTDAWYAREGGADWLLFDKRFLDCGIAGDLHAAHERADALVRKEFPLLPRGHLQFLHRFYVEART